MEAASVEGIEDAADHPERPVRTREEYSHPDLQRMRRHENEARMQHGFSLPTSSN